VRGRQPGGGRTAPCLALVLAVALGAAVVHAARPVQAAPKVATVESPSGSSRARSPQALLRGSIIFVKGNNVWVTTPNGAVQRRITRDGTARSPYSSPSVARNGVIVAVRNVPYLVRNQQRYERHWKGTLARFTYAGRAVGRPFAPPQQRAGDQGVVMALGILDAQVSPDGRRIAYTTGYQCVNPPRTDLPCFYTDVVNANGTAPDVTGNMSFHGGAHWLGNRRLALHYLFYIAVYDLGTPEPVLWFGNDGEDSLTYESQPTLGGNKLAVAYRPLGGVERIRLYASTGPPARPDFRCDITDATGEPNDATVAGDPTLAPDGSALAWEVANATGDSPDEGIWTSPVGDLRVDPCNGVAPRLTVRRGSDPAWAIRPLDTARPRVGRLVVAPNPFEPVPRDRDRDATVFAVNSSEPSKLVVRVYDRGSRTLRRTVSSRLLLAGRQAVSWDGRTLSGRQLRGRFTFQLHVVDAYGNTYTTGRYPLTIL
jgi:hypothetical protein